VTCPHTVLRLHTRMAKVRSDVFRLARAMVAQLTEIGIVAREENEVVLTMAPHRLRHFLFTWLKTQGIDDALIQPYSGHASRHPSRSTADSHSLKPNKPTTRPSPGSLSDHPPLYFTAGDAPQLAPGDTLRSRGQPVRSDPVYDTPSHGPMNVLGPPGQTTTPAVPTRAKRYHRP
jgi:hypothetical protein